MRGKRFKPEQISIILQAYDNGKYLAIIAGEYGVSKAIFTSGDKRHNIFKTSQGALINV